jgi:DNA-binding PadR family transcriptional regulator
MNPTIKKALEELNQEGLLNGTKITPKGKAEVEEILRQDSKISDVVFNVFWKKLENDFYEGSPKEFVLKVIELERLLAKSGINLYERLKEK